MIRKILVAAATLAGLAACATAPAPKLSLADYPNLAILSVMVAPDIGWADEPEKSPSLMDIALNKKSETTKNPDAKLSLLLNRADDLVEPAEATARAGFSALAANKLLPRDAMTASASYKALPQAKSLSLVYLKPTDYGFINDLNAKSAAALKAELGVDASVYLEYKFQTKMFTGVGHVGTMKLVTTLKAHVVNAAGKRVYTNEYVVTSDKAIPVGANAFDAELVKQLYTASMQQAIERFVANLSK